MILAISWSGGKDSYLAYHLAREQGHEIRYAIHMNIADKVFYHGPEELVFAQVAECLGMRLFIARTSWGSYERDFKNILRSLKKIGVEGVVFGDIFIEDHRRWGVRVAEETGLVPLHPLFGLDPDYLLDRYIKLGVKSIIIRVVNEDPYKNYLGKIIDEEFFKELILRGLDPLGERGEYHTFVIDAPYMRCSLDISGGYEELVKAVFSGKEYVYRIYVPTRYRILSKNSF